MLTSTPGLVDGKPVFSKKGGKRVERGNFVLVSALGWVVSSSLGEIVMAEIVVLVGGPVVTREVIASGSPVTVGMDKLASVLGLLATEGVASDSLLEKLGGVLETGVLVSEE